MDKGTQEEVNPRLKEYAKLSKEIRETKDVNLLTLVQMMSLGFVGVYEDFSTLGKNLIEFMQNNQEIVTGTLGVIQRIEMRLAELEKNPNTQGVELENLRKKLRAQENKLKKHAPMLEFLEQWVDAQRNRYIGEH
jgi:uncharacterized coiled-coil protein SlyX